MIDFVETNVLFAERLSVCKSNERVAEQETSEPVLASFESHDYHGEVMHGYLESVVSPESKGRFLSVTGSHL